MPDILERIADSSPLMVLDAGFAAPETIDYFGGRRCRLHFCGLPETVASPPQIKPVQNSARAVEAAARQDELLAAWRERFRSVLTFPEDTRFDLCLFWDSFNYMDDLALKAFFEILHPFVRKGGLAHGLIQLREDSKVVNREYGVYDKEQIAMRPGLHGALEVYPRPQARVASMLKGFVVSHGVLRRDGLLEVSLKTG